MASPDHTMQPSRSTAAVACSVLQQIYRDRGATRALALHLGGAAAGVDLSKPLCVSNRLFTFEGRLQAINDEKKMAEVDRIIADVIRKPDWDGCIRSLEIDLRQIVVAADFFVRTLAQVRSSVLVDYLGFILGVSGHKNWSAFTDGHCADAPPSCIDSIRRLREIRQASFLPFSVFRYLAEDRRGGSIEIGDGWPITQKIRDLTAAWRLEDDWMDIVNEFVADYNDMVHALRVCYAYKDVLKRGISPRHMAECFMNISVAGYIDQLVKEIVELRGRTKQGAERELEALRQSLGLPLTEKAKSPQLSEAQREAEARRFDALFVHCRARPHGAVYAPVGGPKK